jgi:ribonuclease III
VSRKAPGDARRPAGLARRLGHRFARPRLLHLALTHPSATPAPGAADIVAESYERMEFLGDRVVGLVLADLLFHRFPDEAEGALARRFAKLARRESLVAVAESLDLGAYVRMSTGEAGAGARLSPSILADCCEAVIGALYLDGGLDAARPFVARAWEALIAADAAPPSDPKTALQEWAQGRGLALPRYREVARSGPSHAPEFTVELSVAGAAPERAKGRSKRAAERAAAEAMLDRIAEEGGPHAG